MDSVELWVFLLSDTLLDVLLFPPHEAYVWKAMLGFGGYDIWKLSAFATVGAILGTVLNWGMGRALLACRQREIIMMESPRIDRASAFFQVYGVWLLVFCWVPVIGVVITLASGFLTVRFLPMLALVTLTNAAFYAYQIFA